MEYNISHIKLHSSVTAWNKITPTLIFKYRDSFPLKAVVKLLSKQRKSAVYFL